MALKARFISMDLGPHCIYLTLKTGLETHFSFKYKRYKQFSTFFKPKRIQIVLSAFTFQISLEFRRLID